MDKVSCIGCTEELGTEEELFEKETVEWYNIEGEIFCPTCKDKYWQENPEDPHHPDAK